MNSRLRISSSHSIPLRAKSDLAIVPQKHWLQRVNSDARRVTAQSLIHPSQQMRKQRMTSKQTLIQFLDASRAIVPRCPILVLARPVVGRLALLPTRRARTRAQMKSAKTSRSLSASRDLARSIGSVLNLAVSVKSPKRLRILTRRMQLFTNTTISALSARNRLLISS